MRCKALVFLSLVFFTVPALTHQNEPKPVDCTELMGWMAGGVSGQRLNRLVQDRGIAFSVNDGTAKALLSAGAETALIQSLRATHPAIAEEAGASCPALLAQAGELIHQRHYQEAQRILRKLVTADPRNAALHFALGYVRQQLEDWDEAFDEYSDSRDLMPGVSETHGRLAYLFYHFDNGDDAIAEARTALSIDPQNAEAYRYLGLGLYANGRYSAALHAFQQSLAREPKTAEVYYDMGITLRDKGYPEAAAGAYRKAIALNPQFWEAHNNLGLLLHDLRKFDEAIAAYREAKRLAPDEAAIRNNLGNTYCDKGDYDAAIAEFHELFRMNPGWQQGHSCLAKALMAKRDLRVCDLGTQARSSAESHWGRRTPRPGAGPAARAPGARGLA